MPFVSVVIDPLCKLNFFLSWLKFNVSGRETPQDLGKGWVQGSQVAAVEVTWLTQLPGTTETGCTLGSAKPFTFLWQNCCL